MRHPSVRSRRGAPVLAILGAMAAVGSLSTPARATGFNVAVGVSGSGSGLPYVAAPFADGYALATIDQGNTSGYFNRIKIDPTTYIPSAAQGFRMHNENGSDLQYGNVGTITLHKDVSNCIVLAALTPIGSTNDPSAIYALPVTISNNVASQTKDQYNRNTLIPLRTDAALYNQYFGAAVLPDNSGFILVTAGSASPHTTATVTYYQWGNGTDTTITEIGETTITLPTGVPSGYNGNIQCAVTHNFDHLAAYYPYRLTVATCTDGAIVQTRDYRLNTKIFDSSALTVAQKDRLFVSAIPKDNQWTSTVTNTTSYKYNLHTGLDGRVYLAVVNSTGDPVYARTGIADSGAPVWTLSETLDGGLYGTYQAPTFVYLPEGTSGSPPVQVAINRLGLNLPFTNSRGQSSLGFNNPFGFGKKIAMVDGTSNATSAGVVIGIVDGPPPVPNENLQAFPSQSTSSKLNFAYDNSAQKSTSASLGQGVTVGASATLGGEVEGFGAEAEVEAELSQTNTSTYSKVTNSTSETFLYVGTNQTTDNNGNPIFEKKGTIFLARMNFGGYVYQFGTFDDQNNFTPTPGSLLFTQVFPKGGYNVEAQTFYMNPNGPQPGDIQSYRVSDAEQQILNSPNISKINFSGLTGNNNYIYYQFNGGSGAQTAYDYFTSVSQDQTEDISTHESLKVSAKTPVASASVSASQDVDTSRTWGVGTDTHVGISIDAAVANDSSPSAPTNYYSYTVQTYLLKDSNAWLRELLSDDPNGIGMVTPTFPPIGSVERQRNEALKASLVRTSTPWRVEYVVVNPYKNKALRTADSGPTLQNALLLRLTKSGVTTTGQMNLVIAAWESAHRTTPPNVVRSGVYTREIREQDARTATAIAHVWLGRSMDSIQLLIRNLTAGDISVMRQYLNDLSAQDQANWQTAHPNRFGLNQTLAELAKPDIKNVRTHFTEVPPASLNGQ